MNCVCRYNRIQIGKKNSSKNTDRRCTECVASDLSQGRKITAFVVRTKKEKQNERFWMAYVVPYAIKFSTKLTIILDVCCSVNKCNLHH